MQLRLRGTLEEIETAITKLSALLTVYERSRPYPRDGGQVDVYIRVQL